MCVWRYPCDPAAGGAHVSRRNQPRYQLSACLLPSTDKLQKNRRWLVCTGCLADMDLDTVCAVLRRNEP